MGWYAIKTELILIQKGDKIGFVRVAFLKMYHLDINELETQLFFFLFTFFCLY